MRDKKATRHHLSDDQEMTFSHFGNMLTGKGHETFAETLIRLFGTLELAGESWAVHSPRLMAEFPTAGRREPAYWLLALGMEPPDLDEQAAVLRSLGLLSDDEERELAEWRAPAPEFPDISIDAAPARATEVPLFTSEIASAGPGIRAVEDNHANDIDGDIDGDIDAAPVPARPQAEVVEAVAEDEAVQAEAGVQEIPVTPPRILDLPRSSARRRPPEFEGWEHHDGP